MEWPDCDAACGIGGAKCGAINMVTKDYAGDVSVAEAWKLLEQDASAQLIDVRTTAEWAFVGQPDLAPVGREVLSVEWQSFPQMNINPGFVKTVEAEVRGLGAKEDTPLLFLCRSGGRSRAAAIAMTQAGFTRAYNVAGGFEGDLDEGRHRGKRNGWKADGLPWRQS
jgi:rhodanese-related sulfurtransferase